MTKVLLVEDDNNLREIFEMRLQAEGYNTVTAGDGEEALTVAVREKPDLIITDIMMPKLSGFEMLENLRSVPDTSNSKVIMMTALGQAEDRARGEKLGVVKYLVKSQVTLEDFIRVVREVIQPGQAAASAPGTTSITNQESESSMPPQDNAPATNPMPPRGDAPQTNPVPPVSEPASSGQMSTAEEQNSVQNQIDNFVASAPAADPAASANPAAPASGAADSNADAPAFPPTSAPGTDPAGGATPTGGQDGQGASSPPSPSSGL
jgi:CheY-like chemotaxis protein